MLGYVPNIDEFVLEPLEFVSGECSSNLKVKCISVPYQQPSLEYLVMSVSFLIYAQKYCIIR